MGSIRLRELTLRAFRSFVDPVTFSFPETGMVLLAGPSGAGKSNILLALTHLFDCCPLPSTTLQSWASEEPFQVQGRLETDAGEVVVTKGARPSISVAGERTAGSAKAVNERLSKIVGYDPETLAALTYREQKERGRFLTKTDGEKKEFLTSLLGLARFETAIDEAQKSVAALEQTVALELRDFERVKVERANLGRLEAPPTLKDVEPLRVRLAEAEAATDTLKARQGELARVREAALAGVPERPGEAEDLARRRRVLSACRQRIAKAQEAEAERREEATSRQRAIDAEIHRLRTALASMEDTRRKIARLEGRLATLRANECPTCHRSWSDAADEEARVLNDVNELTAILVSEGAVIRSLDTLGAEREAIRFTASSTLEAMRGVEAGLVADLAKADADAMTWLKTQRAEIASRFASDLAQLADELARAHALVPDARCDLHDALSSNKAATEDYERRREAMEHSTARVDALAKLLGNLEGELRQERDWRALVKTYLGSIFDEILAEISAETNNVLARIKNVAHCSLAFKSEAVTLKGKVNKTIVPVVTIGGREAPYRSGCSGGMITSLELAVDLAVGRVIERRTGRAPGWLILDEAFEGYDAETRESCMQVLQEYARERLVLVVDHSSEFKELFGQTISVELRDGRSVVVGN